MTALRFLTALECLRRPFAVARAVRAAVAGYEHALYQDTEHRARLLSEVRRLEQDNAGLTVANRELRAHAYSGRLRGVS